jgi:hypothetical protein
VIRRTSSTTPVHDTMGQGSNESMNKELFYNGIFFAIMFFVHRNTIKAAHEPPALRWLALT